MNSFRSNNSMHGRNNAGYSFGRAARSKETKRNDYISKTFQNAETVVMIKQSKNGLTPGFSFDKAGIDFGATYGTRNFDPLMREAKETPPPGAYLKI